MIRLFVSLLFLVEVISAKGSRATFLTLQHSSRRTKSLVVRSVALPSAATEELELPPRLVFPGGGLFFYWQIGAVSYLRENDFDLSQIPLAGASAGALSATLTATNVSHIKATELALKLAEEAGVWDRPLGLQGVWGPLIEGWLDELLPEDAVEIANERLVLLVTSIPSFRRTRITKFKDRADLIKCNMASVHLPWFLDGKITSNFRNSPHIDGSFLSKQEDYFPDYKKGNVVSLDYQKDPIMAEKANDFVKLASKEGIWSMIDQGRKFAELMDNRGEFELLPRLKR